MAQAIAINFTPPSAAPRNVRPAPTHSTGMARTRKAITAGSVKSKRDAAAIAPTASAESKLDRSGPACSSPERSGRSRSRSPPVGLIGSVSQLAVLHPLAARLQVTAPLC